MDQNIILALCCQSVSVNAVDDALHAHPYSQVRKYLYDTAVIGKRCILQDGKILHQAVMDNVLHNLVYEVDLITIQGSIIQELCPTNSLTTP